MTSASDPRFFEVRHVYRGEWRACARFRLLSDAARYVARHACDGPFEILDADGNVLNEYPREVHRARRRVDTVPEMRRLRLAEDDA